MSGPFYFAGLLSLHHTAKPTRASYIPLIDYIVAGLRSFVSRKLFGSSKATILTESPAGKKQDFLEASPFWDQSTIPLNTYKNKASLCCERAT